MDDIKVTRYLRRTITAGPPSIIYYTIRYEIVDGGLNAKRNAYCLYKKTKKGYKFMYDTASYNIYQNGENITQEEMELHLAYE